MLSASKVQPLSSRSSRGRRKFHHFWMNHCDPGEVRGNGVCVLEVQVVFWKKFRWLLWWMDFNTTAHGVLHLCLFFWWSSLAACDTGVHKTVGNRSGLIGYRLNRSGPVPVWAGIKPVQIQNLNLNSKEWKIPKKISKNISRCDESNGVKFSQKFVHLV